MKIFVAFIFLTAVSLSAHAAGTSPIKSAKCTFTDSTNNFFNRGALTWKVERTTKEVMETTFDQLDNKDGNARMIGNNGSADITVIQGRYGLSLIEITGSGAVMLTTIFLGNGYEHGANVQAVYSRHTAADDALLPSQRVGTCTVFT